MTDQATQGLLSPFLRRCRLRAAAAHLHGTVLDFGCGSGALAGIIPADRYLGVDHDAHSLSVARANFPQHRFVTALDNVTERFDTVVSLAVIEHVTDPTDFLRRLAGTMNATDVARLLVTTPHPAMDWIHDVGARLGLFSSHASDEHEDLLGRAELENVGRGAGLRLMKYSRFLCGANQLAIYSRASGV